MLASAHVVGDAGTGKTRLLTEFAARCRSRGDHVVTVVPDPAWAKVSDAALRTAIRGLARLPEPPTSEAWKGARARAIGGLEILFNANNPRTSAGLCCHRSSGAPRLPEGAAMGARGRRRPATPTRAPCSSSTTSTSPTARAATPFLDVLAEPPVAPALVVVSYAPGRRPATSALPGETRVLGPLPVAMFSCRSSSRTQDAERSGLTLTAAHRADPRLDARDARGAAGEPRRPRRPASAAPQRRRASRTARPRRLGRRRHSRGPAEPPARDGRRPGVCS